MAESKAKLEDSKQVIGQIATGAYKRGGVSSDLSLLLNASSDGNLAAGMDLADQAMRSQNAALDALSEQSATDENVKLRLAAVEAEITDLKSAADAALVREQVARDDAETKKQSLDGIISQTDALSAELLAQRPRIQEKLRTVEAEQVQVNGEIKERQERLIREEAERKRKAAEAAEAERKRAAQKAAEQQAKWEREEADRAKKAREEAARQKKKSTYVKPPYVAPKPQTAPQTVPQERSSWGLIRPVNGGRQTSSFGFRPTPSGTIDYGGRGGYVHAGVDWGFGGQCGTPVHAAADGEVWMAGWGGTSGNKVTISHGVVKGKALATNYHHMQRVVVSAGQNVKQGQTIGYVGTTGNSTGCHMHFETIVNGSAVNPLGLL
ncbi:M23 family metallopeptidase [Paeniglutamicibacter antarcticus]